MLTPEELRGIMEATNYYGRDGWGHVDVGL